jgi:hypothetical protein
MAALREPTGTPRKATAVRKEQEQLQESRNTHEKSAAVEPSRRPFTEPVLTRHERVTRIHLISDDFGGSGTGGSGATFF